MSRNLMSRRNLMVPVALVWLCSTSIGTSMSAWSADPTTPEAAAERATLQAQYGFEADVVADPELDPVVYTEIVPFTAEESAVRLPPDQDLD